MTEPHVIGDTGEHAGASEARAPVPDGFGASGSLKPSISLAAKED